MGFLFFPLFIPLFSLIISTFFFRVAGWKRKMKLIEVTFLVHILESGLRCLFFFLLFLEENPYISVVNLLDKRSKTFMFWNKFSLLVWTPSKTRLILNNYFLMRRQFFTVWGEMRLKEGMHICLQIIIYQYELWCYLCFFRQLWQSVMCNKHRVRNKESTRFVLILFFFFKQLTLQQSYFSFCLICI